MMFNRRHHEMPALNTTSTADISFMLLIFFLVTTSMDTDKGLARQLPPPEKNQQVEETSVDKRLLLQLQITSDNRLLVNHEASSINGLRKRILQHVKTVGSRHLISVNCDPKASYDTYFKMQNEIVAAYKSWRNLTAHKRFHQNYDQLSVERRREIDHLCPQRIAEQYNVSSEGGAQ